MTQISNYNSLARHASAIIKHWLQYDFSPLDVTKSQSSQIPPPAQCLLLSLATPTLRLLSKLPTSRHVAAKLARLQPRFSSLSPRKIKAESARRRNSKKLMANTWSRSLPNVWNQMGRACVHACVRACVRVCGGWKGVHTCTAGFF